MIVFKVFIILFLQIAPGFLALQFFGYFKKQPILFNLAIACGLGGYFITIQLFLLLFIFKLKFNYLYLWFLPLETAILLYFFLKRGNKIKISKPRFKVNLKILLLLLIILTQVCFLLFYVLARPTITYDSVAAWSYKAKALYYQNEVSFNKDSFDYLGGGGHINYPWHVPLEQFWWQKFLGEYNDLYVNLIYVLYFIGVLIILYYALIRYLGSLGALLLVFLLSGLPLFAYHGFNAYADLPLSYFILTAFVLLLAFLKDEDSDELLVLSGIFFGIAFFVKIEGLIYIIAAILSWLLFSWKRKRVFEKAGKFLVGAIMPPLAWIFFLINNNLTISNIEPGLGFHPRILKNLYFSLFVSNSWNIWWYILIIVFLLNIKKIYKEKELLFSWAFLFISLGGFLILYLFTNEYQFALDHTAISRNVLTLTPLSVLALGMTLNKLNL